MAHHIDLSKRNNSHVASKIHHTRDSFLSALHETKETAGIVSKKLIKDAKRYSKEWNNNITHYVRKKPLTALGGAALAGMILALLWRRR